MPFELNTSFADEVMERVNMRGMDVGMVLQDAVRDLAPIDTGEYRDNIIAMPWACGVTDGNHALSSHLAWAQAINRAHRIKWIRDRRFTRGLKGPEYVDMAIWLELGTSKMRAQPHWIPALMESLDAIGDILRGAINDD